MRAASAGRPAGSTDSYAADVDVGFVDADGIERLGSLDRHWDGPGRTAGENASTPRTASPGLWMAQVSPWTSVLGTWSAEVFAFTARVCEAVGWQFRHVGDLDQPYRVNLRWLARYRHRRCLQAPVADELREVFAEPLPLFAGADRVGDRLAVLPVWSDFLLVNLYRAPLGASVSPRHRRVTERTMSCLAGSTEATNATQNTPSPSSA